MMKLTEDQAEIVSDNHNLIFWYMHRRRLNHDEWYGLLAIELCNAVMKHDPIKGSLATYYKLRCDGLVSKEFKKSKSKKRFSNNIQYIENVHNRADPHDLRAMVELGEFLELGYGKVLQMKYEGYSQTEIAKELGISQTSVSKLLRKLKDDYHEFN